MRHKITILFLMLLLVSIQTKAQIGKPQFLIETQRADTSLGTMTIELFPTIAPLHTANFDSLVGISFFDHTAFHRVIPDFMIQGGDPNSISGPRDTWGYGDSTQHNVPAEFTGLPHARGFIGAARDEDPNSANSQFFINVVDNFFLNRNYTVYGRVLDGMEIADLIVNAPRDENDNPYDKIEMFVTKGISTYDTVAAPILLAPENGTEGAVFSQLIEWQPAEGALLYHIQASTDSTFATLFYDDNQGGTSLNLSGLETGRVKYYWRVKSNNGGDVSEFSDARYFVTSINPPNLLTPANGAENVNIEPLCSWEPVPTAVYYKIQIAKNPTFVNSQVVFTKDSIFAESVSVPGLSPDTKYFWRLWAATNNYVGPVSTVWNFTTEMIISVDNEELNPLTFNLNQNYPNPFNPSTTIKYALQNDSRVNVTVFNSVGEIIAELVNSVQDGGYYSIDFNSIQLGTQISSGVYFYRLTAESLSGSENFTSVKKMLLLK